MIKTALGVYSLGKEKSSLHLATMYRVRAAIAYEGERLYEAAGYVEEQLKLLELRHTVQGEALKESGLLDRAPDAFSPSSWNNNVHLGDVVVLPFCSTCSIGLQLYLNAQDKNDQLYGEYLEQAGICFKKALGDRLLAFTKTARMDSWYVDAYAELS